MSDTPTKNYSKFEVKGDYIDGRFTVSNEPSGQIVGISPADKKDHIASFSYSYRSVDSAIECARAAFASWRKTRFEDRAQLLEKYKEVLKKMEPRFSE